MAKRPGTDDGAPSFKRQKTGLPSKVIYAKGVPSDTFEGELAAIAAPFGTVVQTLILSQKKQAFIEFDSVASAMKLVSSYPSTAPAYIRGNPVYFEYSDRSEIKQNPRYGGDGTVAPTAESKFKELPPSTVLLATVTNCRLPISIDNLHQVFRTYGEVLRIVTFQKKNFQALIEYAHLVSAITAKRVLEGKDIFSGCCSLSISFSGVAPPLKVKSNPLRARDFTTKGAGGMPSDGYGFPPPPLGGGMASPDGYGFPPPTPLAGSGTEGCVLLVMNLPEGKITPDNLFTLFGVYGDVLRVKILWNKKDTALIQLATPQQAATARAYLDKIDLIDRKISVVTSKNKSVAPPPAIPKFQNDTTRDYSDSPLHRFNRPGNRNERHIAPPSHSLHVSNLPADINPEELKLFFSGEGEELKIASIKLFGDTKRMAFVNFTSVGEAVIALIRYHNQKYGDRNIKISFSHNSTSRDGP